MTFDQLTNTLRSWGTSKSAAQIRGEIDEEIRFHLEQRTRELEAGGLDHEAAAAAARSRFGDVGRAKLDCLTIQIGERIMLQKIQWIVIGVLSLGLLVLGLTYVVTVQRQRAVMEQLRAEMFADMAMARQNEALAQERLSALEGAGAEEAGGVPRLLAAEPELSPADLSALWLARFLEKPQDARHGASIANALVDQLDPEEAVRVVSELWNQLGEAHRQQCLKAFAFQHGHPGTLAILHLGATDAAPEVQNWALRYLQDYAFQSFGDDYDGYLVWYERWRDVALADVLAGNAREFVTSLHGRRLADVADELRDFERLDLRPGDNLGVDLRGVFLDAGALLLIEDWIASGDEDAIERGYSWAAALAVEESWLRDHVLPALHANDPNTVGDAIRALASADQAWAVPELVGYLERNVLASGEELSRSGTWAAASALADIGDPAVIPTLIGLIAARPCYDTVYGLGYFGLGKLTSVSYDESHDGTWWMDWWSKNLSRFPPDVRALPIPAYSPR